jgi:hypothetical protein
LRLSGLPNNATSANIFAWSTEGIAVAPFDDALGGKTVTACCGKYHSQVVRASE